MSDSIGGPHPMAGGGRKLRYCWIFGAIATAAMGPSTQAGAIRNVRLKAQAQVSIAKANPWSNYWVKALRQHALQLKGPKTATVVTLNADGSVSPSPFIRYMQWREGLNAKRFATFHPELVQLLRRVKDPATPGTVIPPTPGVPIEPPDFTPITPTQEVIPPKVPEPSTVLMAAGMIGFVAAARRARRRA